MGPGNVSRELDPAPRSTPIPNAGLDKGAVLILARSSCLTVSPRDALCPPTQEDVKAVFCTRTKIMQSTSAEIELKVECPFWSFGSLDGSSASGRMHQI